MDTNRTIYTFGPNGNMSHLKIHRIKGEDSSVSAEIDVEFTNYNQHPNPWASVNIGDLHMWEIFDAVYQMNREPSLIDKMPFLSINSPYSISITSTNQYNSEPKTDTYELEYGTDENGLVTQEILYHVNSGNYSATIFKYIHINE